MTNQEAIIRQFAFIGTMTDEGAALFAADNDIDATAEADAGAQKAISTCIDSFLDQYMMRSQSVSENGISLSWTSAQTRGLFLLKLRKYGIVPNADMASNLGLSVVIDVTNKW